jgi:hypothetical protein
MHARIVRENGFNPLNREFPLNNIHKSTPYLTGNTFRLHYKAHRLMLFGETVAVYCENHTEHTDTLCGQNAESVPHRKHITSPLQSPTG